MGLTAKFECDGRGCYIEHEISPATCFEFESLPDDWSHDEINDFCYCPGCARKLIASGELDE